VTARVRAVTGTSPFTTEIEAVYSPDPDEQAAARHYVQTRIADEQERAELLAMLGLDAA
jgi:hypothetical protein